MKAYLIDPFAERVTEVEFSGDTHDICRLIDCRLFEPVYVNNKGDIVWVDEEGLLKDLEKQKFFSIARSTRHPLAGKGLFLGSTRMGVTKEPMATLVDVASRVSFFNIHQVRALSGLTN